MQLTPENLRRQNFTLIEKVEHAQLDSFLDKHTWNFPLIKYSYFLALLILSVVTVRLIWNSHHHMPNPILFAGLGILIAFVLIPIHELIHYLMYKIFGADNVKIAPYLRLGYILTKADLFVVDKKSMLLIASAPFLIISTFGAILFCCLSGLWQIAISSAILFHASLCYADLRILDYFMDRNVEIYMYDDVKARASFFYKHRSKGLQN